MKPRVLIVEDDAVSLKLMRDVLQAHGFETRAVTDGAQALGQAVGFDADLVVMDMGLPGLDGVEATRLLKGDVRTFQIPVVAVTAYAMPDDERRMRDAGCDAFLSKPLKLQQLVTTVEALIAGRISPS